MLKSRMTTLAVCAMMALVAACGTGTDPEEEARNQEWQWLQQTKQELDAKRSQLAELAAREAMPAEPESEGEPGDEPATDAEGGEEASTPGAAAQRAALEEEVTALSEQFSSRLVDFLNDDPIVENQPPTERQLAALRMKSDEDMVLAQEWIDKGGDYKRAIDIYTTALQLDPENAQLQAARAAAEANRYMSADRFAQAEEGMSREEVRAVLGQANLHNIRQYADRGVVAWFYPTSATGDAAGVWFEVNDETGESSAYQLKYDAIQHQEGGEEGEEG
jgi:tetratricopeptide (TPR) repeat protein